MAEAALTPPRGARSRGQFVRSWPVWSLPLAALLFVLAVDLAAGGGLGAAIVITGFGGAADLITFAAVACCAVISVEVVRRLGEPTGAHQGLMTVWTLPAALLLPAPFALLVAVPDQCWSQWRRRPAPTYRRVFTAAAVGLAHLAANQVFHAIAGGSAFGDAWARHGMLLLGAALLAGAGCIGGNLLLVSTAIRLTDVTVRWRDLLADREMLTLSGVEVATGVAVTALVAQTPALLIVTLPAIILLHRSLLHAQLTAAARTDAKTGLLNAVAWQRELDRDLARCVREHRPLSVLLLDLDHFKRVNDSYGHLAGDRVLVAIADLLRAELRGIDLIGRFGGEEFVAGLTADASAAQLIADRLCRRIASLTVDHDGHLVSVTASIGVTTLIPGRTDSATEILAAADSALYAAKRAGRNRTAHT